MKTLDEIKKAAAKQGLTIVETMANGKVTLEAISDKTGRGLVSFTASNEAKAIKSMCGFLGC